LRYLGHCLTGAALLLALACGGGSGGGTPVSTTPASELVYTDPVLVPSAWQLVADASSTNTRLVLDLQPPAGAVGQGVTLTLTLTGNSSAASWHNFGTGAAPNYLNNIVYPSPLSPTPVSSVLNSALRLVVAQAPTAAPVTYGTLPVLQVALDLAPSAVTGAIGITASEGGHLLAAALPVTAATPGPELITVTAGALQAQ